MLYFFFYHPDKKTLFLFTVTIQPLHSSYVRNQDPRVPFEFNVHSIQNEKDVTKLYCTVFQFATLHECKINKDNTKQ